MFLNESSRLKQFLYAAAKLWQQHLDDSQSLLLLNFARDVA
jgi:hypothetical protein